jgi:hypothetical protein
MVKWSLRIYNLLVLTLITLGSYLLFNSFSDIHQQSHSKPILLCETREVDFGDVIAGQTLSYDLKIKNAGNELLIIDGLTTSCGCASSELSKPTVEPNETAHLMLSVDTTRKLGSFIGKLTIKSNSFEEREHVIGIRANILRPMQFEPDYLAFTNMVLGQIREQSFIIRSRIGKLKKIRAIPFESDGIKAYCCLQNHEPEVPARFGYKICALALKPGQFDFDMQFVATTDDDVDFFQSVRVALYAPGPIKIEPQSIWITGGGKSKVYKRVQIKANGPFVSKNELVLNYNKQTLEVLIKKTKEGAELLVRSRYNEGICNSESAINDAVDLVVVSNGNKYKYKIPVHIMFDHKNSNK